MTTRLNVTEERVEMAKLAIVNRMTRKEIAEKFGVHPQVVTAVVSDPKFRRIIREKYGR